MSEVRVFDLVISHEAKQPCYGRNGRQCHLVRTTCNEKVTIKNCYLYCDSACHCAIFSVLVLKKIRFCHSSNPKFALHITYRGCKYMLFICKHCFLQNLYSSAASLKPIRQFLLLYWSFGLCLLCCCQVQPNSTFENRNNYLLQ